MSVRACIARTSLSPRNWTFFLSPFSEHLFFPSVSISFPAQVYADFEQEDIDMACPGVTFVFGLVDYLILAVPLCIALGTFIYKVTRKGGGEGRSAASWAACDLAMKSIGFRGLCGAGCHCASRQAPFSLAGRALSLPPPLCPTQMVATNANIDFADSSEAMTSALLIIAPLVAFVGVLLRLGARRAFYQSQLSTTLAHKTLASNETTLSFIVNSSGQQEAMEAILAYFFAWRGQEAPAYIALKDLDVDVEVRVKGLSDRGCWPSPSQDGHGVGFAAPLGEGAKREPPSLSHIRALLIIWGTRAGSKFPRGPGPPGAESHCLIFFCMGSIPISS